MQKLKNIMMFIDTLLVWLFKIALEFKGLLWVKGYNKVILENPLHFKPDSMNMRLSK